VFAANEKRSHAEKPCGMDGLIAEGSFGSRGTTVRHASRCEELTSALPKRVERDFAQRRRGGYFWFLGVKWKWPMAAKAVHEPG
jgi:hypothetical protein